MASNERLLVYALLSLCSQRVDHFVWKGVGGSARMRIIGTPWTESA